MQTVIVCILNPLGKYLLQLSNIGSGLAVHGVFIKLVCIQLLACSEDFRARPPDGVPYKPQRCSQIPLAQ